MGQAHRIFDSLGYVNELKGAGVSEKQAIVHAETLFAVLDDQMITRQGMHDMERKFSSDMQQLDSNIKVLEVKIKDLEVKRDLEAKIENLEIRLSADIQGLEAKLSYDIQRLEAKLDHSVQDIRRDLEVLQNKMIIKLGSGMVVLLTLLGVFLKLPI